MEHSHLRGSDDEVADLGLLHGVADLLDDADVLVAHRRGAGHESAIGFIHELFAA